MINRAVHEKLDYSNPMPFISTYSPVHPNYIQGHLCSEFGALAGADHFWMQTVRAAK